MQTLFFILVIGYLTGLLGFLPGILMGEAVEKLGRRFQGPLMGFTGGLLIAFVCFEMLPKAFETSGLYVGVAGILLGVLLCAYMELRIPALATYMHIEANSAYIKTGLLLALGVGLHNIPEGMAVGSLLNLSPQSGLRMALVITIHCIPEAVAVSVPMIKGGMPPLALCKFVFIMALPMCIGTVSGALLSQLSPLFVTVCLGFSGGVMLYMTCGEVLPGSKDIWNGRLTSVLAIIGFVVGVIVTAGI